MSTANPACADIWAWLASPPSTKLFARIVINAYGTEEKPRLAASSYLNSAPLIWSFTHGSLRDSVIHTEAVPARCAEMLSSDEVDFGLVPIIEYQRIAGAKLVPDVCVGSRKKVRSVLLVSRLNNLKKIGSVALDESSRTSATLTKIIFKEFLGIEPTWVTSSPDISRMLRQSDAALIIGDPAMTFSHAGLKVWDLASVWHDYTGTGFVFAMWMAKGNVHPALLSLDFTAARDEGVNSIDEILEDYRQRLGLPREDLLDYLTNNLTFDLDNELKSGMQCYFELAAQHGLIDRPRLPEYLQMRHAGLN